MLQDDLPQGEQNKLCRRSSMSQSTENLLKNTADVPSNVGTYLARRMIELGIRDYFVVPGDFNLVLLDQILLFPQLRLISCCNELNAAYAADGYARAKVRNKGDRSRASSLSLAHIGLQCFARVWP
jgi:hypothetical protein